MPSPYSPESALPRLSEDGAVSAAQISHISEIAGIHAKKISRDHGERAQKTLAQTTPPLNKIAELARGGGLGKAASEYLQDAAQRFWMTLDVLRQRGNNDAAHEAAGTPPVLIYDYEVALDGKTLPRPCNYVLLKIIPPHGVEVFDWKRPYMIIDPRAGHGAGIGGFKPDSQVGVALHHGHPVYFCIFRPEPEPEQTLADVMRAEAEFVAEIRRRHPEAPKPIIVGNCQGGWATLALAAANPDITGPLVINGAPVAAWSGRMGENPMRYNGGLLGGAAPALLVSDLGAGVFDGAHLVSNFEMLNPGRNYFGKYYDLFANVEKVKPGFLEFERWWGGYHYMNEAEISWIIRNIFVGNKLSRGEAKLEHGRRLDIKAIRSPIIVFASHGDNITPPQQALNWIADTFTDEQEIRVRGHRILYMIHEKVGHLGIFVSSSIAKKEHTEVTSTLKAIEALAPGLYEMTIDEEIGEGVDARFRVSFHERNMSDLAKVDDTRDDEHQFATVSRLSDLGCEIYDMVWRPLVQASISKETAAALRKVHPGRTSRRMFSDDNPLMGFARDQAEKAEKARKPADPANPFLALEKIWAGGVVQAFDFWRDVRDATYELTFFSLYGSPAMKRLGASHDWKRASVDAKELAHLPEVEAILLGVDRGGFDVAVIRMLILMAQARHSVRRDRLERSAKVLGHDEPFASLGAEKRAALIREQSTVVEFAPEQAIATLPTLLPESDERKRAIDVVEYIAGAVGEMDEDTVRMLRKLRAVLGLPDLVVDVPGDPLKLAADLASVED
jgi:pimeloyl-ACP methyl ester carboxylesterase/tellurite resistance protein